MVIDVRLVPRAQHRKYANEALNRAGQRLSAGSIDRLVDAIAKGADVSLLLSKQQGLKMERVALSKRLDELET